LKRLIGRLSPGSFAQSFRKVAVMSLDRSTASSGHFTDSRGHVLAELERIDLLIRAQVARARDRNDADGEFQGLYISEQEVDTLLAAPRGLPNWAESVAMLPVGDLHQSLRGIAASIEDRKAQSLSRGVRLRLDELASLFALTPFDLDVMLICLAPEIDLRYERLFAYLQDDVTKKRPSVDLILNLLCTSFESKLAQRERFLPQAPLLKYHLLNVFDDPAQLQPPLLSKYLKADERVIGYLLDSDDVDDRLAPYVRRVVPAAALAALLLPEDVKLRLAAMSRPERETGREPILYLQGPYGVGKQLTAEALCHARGLALLVVDGERLIGAEEVTARGEHLGVERFGWVVRLVIREAALQGAALYWAGFDALLADERRAWLIPLLVELEQARGLSFLAGDALWEPVDALHEVPFVRVEMPRPSYAARLQLWRLALPQTTTGLQNVRAGDHEQAALVGREVDELELKALADKFRFSGGQIRDAANTARNLARWRDPDAARITLADLYAACRLQSNRKLSALAQKITPHYTWNDIVLPADQVRQLREICNQVKYRAKVYGEWGFDRKLALGKGLNVLFAGPSGTGKTMAAEIMAGELGLELYKIDLSSVVSKYIGETEKNLARIFSEAETSNAILFFDEADALFGKRSEVRDSHDRYANVEIAYLLQRMEEYDGMVILATNLQKNMDDAFVRRMHFTVDFPFPAEKDRRQIWEKVWPAETPRSQELDLGFMARRFAMAGGNIKNVALAAAFLAADDGQVVDMRHLIRATQREFQKMGKVVVEGEFGEYGRYMNRDK
jgi:AAA+ superfamily predicted ATPase